MTGRGSPLSNWNLTVFWSSGPPDLISGWPKKPNEIKGLDPHYYHLKVVF